ncbi:MAG: RluA family pseudouridine synthase [Alphaproteobacteria bacterium]|nr:RluA family pseudouridine synthase [Alphaproteobacteria bacterium]
MSGVQTKTIAPQDDGIRLDRWFARHYPDLKNGRLQRLLRGKNIRVNGAKATAGQRLAAGDAMRIPPLDAPEKENAPRDLSKADAAFMQGLVLYRDNDVIALNKPAGIAVQGGTKTERHIDGMLDALRFGAPEKPRLVHRLDKETSGVLLLARHAKAAEKLTKAFASRDARKAYWAVVVGRPKIAQGKIDAPLAKKSAGGRDSRTIDADTGQRAITLYRVADSLANRASWLELFPLTGRTHQLRIHAAQALNTPIAGDAKYGGDRAGVLGLPHQMHLHARAIQIPHPSRGVLNVTAPIPPHMADSFRFLGFEEADVPNPFALLQED